MLLWLASRNVRVARPGAFMETIAVEGRRELVLQSSQASQAASTGGSPAVPQSAQDVACPEPVEGWRPAGACHELRKKRGGVNPGL